MQVNFKNFNFKIDPDFDYLKYMIDKLYFVLRLCQIFSLIWGRDGFQIMGQSWAITSLPYML